MEMERPRRGRRLPLRPVSMHVNEIRDAPWLPLLRAAWPAPAVGHGRKEEQEEADEALVVVSLVVVFMVHGFFSSGSASSKDGADEAGLPPPPPSCSVVVTRVFCERLAPPRQVRAGPESS